MSPTNNSHMTNLVGQSNLTKYFIMLEIYLGNLYFKVQSGYHVLDYRINAQKNQQFVIKL